MRTALARKADNLASRIYCSLPFGYRLARVLVKISMETREILGRVALAEMIKAGVSGIPDIKGKPAEDYAEAVKRRGADGLPRGSGSALGEKVWNLAKRKYPRGLLVEDALSQVMVRMVERPFFDGFRSYKDAEAFLLKSVLNALADVVRHIKRSPVTEVELDPETMGDRGFEQLEHLLNGIQLRRLMGELHRLDPRALQWFNAQLEGRKNKELAEMWGVSEPRVHQIITRLLPKIRELITDSVEDAEEEAVS